ncbi:MAG: PAS domain-containing sensor histidine kinase [Clostridiaceae bacterium]|nr:PAS domain-containing sensor histidine kinase [Clostridiaceae bacterium]
MENDIIDKNQQLGSQVLTDDKKLEDTYIYMNELHLNKGRGFAIYRASDFLLLRSNDEYEFFLIKQYGINGICRGKTLKEIGRLYSSQTHMELLDKALKNGKAFFRDNFKHITCTNEEIFLDVTLMPIYNEDKKLVFIVESFTDVTQLEKQKIQIDFLKKQKEFFVYICHEFKTPLTIIISAIQAIKLICKDDLSPRSLMYLKKIHQGSLQQWRLVTQLLDILKSDSGYLKTRKKNQDIVKMTKAICNAVSVYANTKGITLKFSSMLKEQIIGIDDDKYERILLNLLSNAIKFTPSGNSVNVRVSLVEDKVKIIVKDSGIGISKDDIGEIFQLFSRLDNSLTRKTEGTGIGLHLVKELTTAMDGTITVTSTVGKGSSFILLLPIKKVGEEMLDESCYNLTGNHLVEMTNIEFSNVYFD